MRTFSEPEMEFVVFEEEDVISTSGCTWNCKTVCGNYCKNVCVGVCTKIETNFPGQD